ncbi:MAG: glycosyltransferase family 2 protein [Clostridia bacterium]|nr:glycosyltransferase family 2 protein [Clostridia bacterium]
MINKHPVLSIVMCVFNTDETLLKESLDSIFASAEKNIEVVFVDDGSTKDYTNLLKDYQNIKYFKTENQGTLKARIYGARKASAKYVCYADSDDTVSELYYAASLEKAKQTDADIVVNDWAFHTESTKYVCVQDETICKNICYENDVILEKFMEQRGLQHSFYVLWNKLFKKDLLLKALEEVEKYSTQRMLFAEDLLISFFACLNAKKMVNTHIGYYFYRIHNSQQIAVVSEEKLKHHIISQTQVFDIMEQKLKSLELFEDFESYFVNWKKLLASGNYANAKNSKYKSLLPLIKEKYKLKNVSSHFSGAGKYYSKQRVLPHNIAEVDLAVKKVYYSNKYLKIYAKSGSYFCHQARTIIELFNKKAIFVKRKKYATMFAPKEKVSLKQRILHNFVVYKVGMALFPKGSKIRKFLKSKL